MRYRHKPSTVKVKQRNFNRMSKATYAFSPVKMQHDKHGLVRGAVVRGKHSTWKI